MAKSKSSTSIYPTIFLEGSRSLWLPIIYFANAFFTPFLLPAEKLEAGYTMHHWDFVTAVSGAALIVVFRAINKNPSQIFMAISIFTSGLLSAFAPFLWAYVVLPHGIPLSLRDKWGYVFSGPVAQVALFALLIGTITYVRKSSNAVAEARSSLNVLRREVNDQIERERANIREMILATVKPAILSVESNIQSGAHSSAISKNIYSIIDNVVRPLSHYLDANAEHVNYEIDSKAIKREFRKKRIRSSLKGSLPLKLAISAPMSIFLYLNFNFTAIAYTQGFKEALSVSAPFIICSFIIFSLWWRISRTISKHLSAILWISVCISLLQALLFATSIVVFGSRNLAELAPSFAFTTFFFTLLPAIYSLGIVNLRENLERESKITSEIAENLSVIKRQLWAIRKKFAREIHGGLQSKLHVLALNSERNEINQDQFIEALHNELSSVLALEADKPRIENFRTSITEISEFWEGIISIKPDVSEEVYRTISGDAFLVECLYEVIREAINNAVKHSGATELSIQLVSIGDSTIQLTIENDVTKDLSVTQGASLGTAIYKELAHTWALEINSQRVVFTATFKLSDPTKAIEG